MMQVLIPILLILGSIAFFALQIIFGLLAWECGKATAVATSVTRFTYAAAKKHGSCKPKNLGDLLCGWGHLWVFVWGRAQNTLTITREDGARWYGVGKWTV